MPAKPHVGKSSSPALKCAHCSYQVIGLPRNRCPECGRSFDPYWLALNQHYAASPVIARILRYGGRPLLCVLIALLVSRMFGPPFAFLFLLVAAPLLAAWLLYEIV